MARSKIGCVDKDDFFPICCLTGRVVKTLHSPKHVPLDFCGAVGN